MTDSRNLMAASGLVLQLIVGFPSIHAGDVDRAAKEALRLEKELDATIKDATGDVTATLKLHEREAAKIESQLSDQLKQPFTDKMRDFDKLVANVHTEEKKLLQLQKDAHAKVQEIEGIRSDLTWYQQLSKGFGSGFLFAAVTVVFQVIQQRRANEQHRMEKERHDAEMEQLRRQISS